MLTSGALTAIPLLCPVGGIVGASAVEKLLTVNVGWSAVPLAESLIPAFSRHFGHTPRGASGGKSVLQSRHVFESFIWLSTRNRQGHIDEAVAAVFAWEDPALGTTHSAGTDRAWAIAAIIPSQCVGGEVRTIQSR